jgi:hypothetical protein
VRGFALQLEVTIGGEAEIVLRFDTAHGYVHEHLFAAQVAQRRRRLRFPDWASAYTYCYEYVKRNWDREIVRFIRDRR